jgi:hypothetical protein
MRLCGLDLEILYADLNSFAPNFPCDAQLQQFSRTHGIGRWPKKKSPHEDSIVGDSTAGKSTLPRNFVSRQTWACAFSSPQGSVHAVDVHENTALISVTIVEDSNFEGRANFAIFFHKDLKSTKGVSQKNK